MSAITLYEAVDLNKTYRDNKAGILDPKVDPDVLPICETFDRADFDDLLSQTDCQKIRIYLGMNDKLEVRIVAVGVNSDDEDILPIDAELIMERANRCPKSCPPSSPLNS